VFGGNADEQASFEVLDTYLELGGNFIDSADVYSKWIPGHRGGESETVIGNWMKSRGVRDRVVVATKVGSAMGPGPQNKGLHRGHVERALKASLKRLQVDAIDIYYAHQDDPQTPLEESLGHFDELVRAGHVRSLGASNYPAERLREALELQETRGWARYEIAQPAYSLMNRLAFEGGVAAVCREFGLAVFGFAALAGGFLTGKYRRDAELPDSKRAKSVQSRYMDERGWRVADAVVGTFSSLLGEALLAGAVAVLMNFPEARYYFGDEVERYSRIAVWASSPRGAARAVRRIMAGGSAYRERFVESAMPDLRYLFGPLDGHSAERVVTAGMDLSKRVRR